MGYRRIDLDRRANAYIHEHILHNVSMSRRLRERNIAEGRAYLLTGVFDGSIDYYDFKDGTLFSQDESDEMLRTCIKSHLLEKEDNAVVLLDSMAEKGQVLLNERKSRMFFVGSEVYHVILSEDAADDAKIDTAIMEARNSWLNMGVFTEMHLDLGHGEMSEREFGKLIDSSSLLFVDAYDLDAYLFCEGY